MVNFLDGIILLILAAGVWQGLRRGLIATAGSFLGFIGGIWLAGRYYLPFARFLGESLGLRKLFAGILFPFCAGIPAGITEFFPAFTGGAEPATLHAGFPLSLWEPLNSLQAGLAGTSRALLLADSLVKLIAFFLIWVGAGFVIGLIAAILTRVARLIFLGGVNRLGGAGLGLITQSLTLMVVVGMLTPVILGLTMGLTVPGTGWESLSNAWRTSLLIPYFTKGWEATAPVLQQVFQVI